MSRDTYEAGAMSRGMCMTAAPCAGSQAAKEEKCQTVVCVHCPIYKAFKELARWSKKQKRVCNKLKLTPGKHKCNNHNQLIHMVVCTHEQNRMAHLTIKMHGCMTRTLTTPSRNTIT
jgi:hypothetical protein